MHNYPLNNTFWYYNLKLHEMIDMHSKYDIMQKNRIFYALICINNHVIACYACMLSAMWRNLNGPSEIQWPWLNCNDSHL